MWAAWRSLPDESRSLLWRLVVHEEKPHQIAPGLGTTPNGVASRSKRARERLRQTFLSELVANAGEPDCREVRRQLGGYVRDSLPVRARERVDEHLDRCARCRAAVLDVVDVDAAIRLRVAPVLLPGAFAAASGVGAAGAVGAAGGRGRGCHGRGRSRAPEQRLRARGPRSRSRWAWPRSWTASTTVRGSQPMWAVPVPAAVRAVWPVGCCRCRVARRPRWWRGCTRRRGSPLPAPARPDRARLGRRASGPRLVEGSRWTARSRPTRPRRPPRRCRRRPGRDPSSASRRPRASRVSSRRAGVRGSADRQIRTTSSPARRRPTHLDRRARRRADADADEQSTDPSTPVAPASCSEGHGDEPDVPRRATVGTSPTSTAPAGWLITSVRDEHGTRVVEHVSRPTSQFDGRLRAGELVVEVTRVQPGRTRDARGALHRPLGLAPARVRELSVAVTVRGLRPGPRRAPPRLRSVGARSRRARRRAGGRHTPSGRSARGRSRRRGSPGSAGSARSRRGWVSRRGRRGAGPVGGRADAGRGGRTRRWRRCRGRWCR